VQNTLTLFRKDIAMKRIILAIAILGVLSLLSAPLFADGGRYPNIVKVNQFYHGGHHGGYHDGYQGGYYGGWNTYRVYQAPPPVWQYPPVQSTMFPNVPPWPPRQNYPASYYYYPNAGFYYSNPNIAIGVEF
jgi:hypothetical protein